MTQAPYLGPSGVGQTSHWAIEEEPLENMKTAPKSFMSWPQIQKPRTNIVTPRHSDRAPQGNLRVVDAKTVLKIVT